MAAEWQTVVLICSNCRKTTNFRFYPGRIQYDNTLRWVEVGKSAEIVICNHCGASIYISSVKALGEL